MNQALKMDWSPAIPLLKSVNDTLVLGRGFGFPIAQEAALKFKETCSILRNIIKFTNCTLQDAIKMACENPAKKLSVFDQKGSIAINKDADLVVLDENLQVKLTLSSHTDHSGKRVLTTVPAIPENTSCAFIRNPF